MGTYCSYRIGRCLAHQVSAAACLGHSHIWIISLKFFEDAKCLEVTSSSLSVDSCQSNIDVHIAQAAAQPIFDVTYRTLREPMERFASAVIPNQIAKHFICIRAEYVRALACLWTINQTE